MSILYKIKTATKKDIYNHLIDCNDIFIPKLDTRVNIEIFSNKIFEKTITFEAWNKYILIGLISAYLNDVENQIGFINNVSVIQKYHKYGIATQLLTKLEDYAKINNFKQIKLEVCKDNISAVNLYKKHKFNQIENNGDFVIMKKEIED